jgi:hypothetical protein
MYMDTRHKGDDDDNNNHYIGAHWEIISQCMKWFVLPEEMSPNFCTF